MGGGFVYGVGGFTCAFGFIGSLSFQWAVSTIPCPIVVGFGLRAYGLGHLLPLTIFLELCGLVFDFFPFDVISM